MLHTRLQENTMINTDVKKVEIEAQVLELKITEFNYWEALKLLKKYFLGMILPLLKEARSGSDSDEAEIDIFNLLDQLMVNLEDDELEQFSKDFLKNTKLRLQGEESWTEPDENLGVAEGLVAIKEVAILNFITFSKAASVLGLGDLVARAEEMMEGSQED